MDGPEGGACAASVGKQPSKGELLSPSSKLLNGSSRLSQISRDRPFAYPDMHLSPITRKGKYRELFTEHFEKARKDTGVWKPSVDSKIEQEGRKINKFKDMAEFIDVKMQTAILGTYDYQMSLDQNLEVYKNQKVLQDESDQVNFLR